MKPASFLLLTRKSNFFPLGKKWSKESPVFPRAGVCLAPFGVGRWTLIYEYESKGVTANQMGLLKHRDLFKRQTARDMISSFILFFNFDFFDSIGSYVHTDLSSLSGFLMFEYTYRRLGP